MLEELGAAGCPLLMMVVSPAICGTVIGKFGTDEQKQRWLPGLADGSITMGFAITEPDAGSNSHEITTVARRDGDEWVLTGRKVWISGVDQADALLVVGKLADSGKGTLRPALFVVPTDSPGLTAHPIPMEIISPEQPVPALPRRRPAAGRRAGRPPRPGHRAAVRRAQPGAGHGRGLLARRRPAGHAQGHRVRPRPARSGAPRSAPTRGWPTRWRPARSRSSAPG